MARLTRHRSPRSRVGAQHADWLTLVEPSGVFLTLTVLREAMPNGLPALPPEVRIAAREWAASIDWDDPGDATAWIEHLLGVVLGWGPRLVAGENLPDTMTYTVAEHATTLRPDYALLSPDRHPRVLVCRYPAGTRLDARIPALRQARGAGGPKQGAGWSATPIERTAVLCRALGVPIGIATNARHLALVYAPAGTAGGYATWDTALFAEGAESALLDALAAVAGARRFFAAAPGEGLADLLAKSADRQAELTTTLGLQVRRANELLVAAISRANLEADGRLLRGIPPQLVYEAAATVMMRLVFLLYAEERGLLPAGDEVYAANYAVCTLGEQLQEATDAGGDEPLELRSSAWYRLLATFRAVYAGVEHDLMRLPAYGGSLFDPDRFPFLEGRRHHQPWPANPAHPLPVDDLTVREILAALQWITTTESGATEARRLSFRTLDVEQIGHVYESTLDHSAVRATEVIVGLIGRQGIEPELPLAELEAKASAGGDELMTYLREHTGKTARQLTTLLAKPVDDAMRLRLATAAENDPALLARLTPFAHLLREDLRGLPIVFPAGTIYVTETSHRRDTGTEYTPKELADELVLHALEPLVYHPGPAQTADRATWRLRPAAELLALRICDPAVGSGAILVAAARYLGDRLVEAWTAEDAIPAGYRYDPTVAHDENDLVVLARRAVADQCLYGVDRDHMAVEMAKLSLWLTTMSRERPFTFVDHAIRAGDSLLGLTSIEQVVAVHMDPVHGRELLGADVFGDLSAAIKPVVDEALQLRRTIAAAPVVTVADVDRKTALLARSNAALAEAGIIADLVVGAALMSGGRDTALDQHLTRVRPDIAAVFEADGEDRTRAFERLRGIAEQWLDDGKPAAAPLRRPLHWPLAFPEILSAGGFDAMIGNPPFLGGQRLTARIGTDMRDYLVRWTADGRRGSADLVTYFFLKAARVARSLGFLATNTIAQGDTREVGLDWLLADGWTIPYACKSRPWPGSATLEIAQVWATRDQWPGERELDGRSVREITAGLDAASRVIGAPYKLAANAGVGFMGSTVLGMGFTLTESKASEWIAADPRNADVLFPYLNGQDLNSSPAHAASRWIVNFHDWTEDRARTYALPFAHVNDQVRPERRRLRADGRPAVSPNSYRFWWRYERTRPELYGAISELDHVVAITLVSSVVQPVRVPNGQVFAHLLGIFASNSSGFLGLLASAIHGEWVRKYASSLETRIRYTPSDVFETFPFPTSLDSLGAPGEAMESARNDVMRGRNIGLTATYNLVNDPAVTDPDVAALRAAHVALDVAVLAAYGWSDLDPRHGYYETAQGRRFTIHPQARDELLDRLLELNHERHAAELAAAPQGTSARSRSRARTPRAPSAGQESLL